MSVSNDLEVRGGRVNLQGDDTFRGSESDSGLTEGAAGERCV